MFELFGHALIVADDLVECVGDLAEEAGFVTCHAHRKIARLHRLQRMQQFMQFCGVTVQPVARFTRTLHGHGRSGGAFSRLVRGCSFGLRRHWKKLPLTFVNWRTRANGRELLARNRDRQQNCRFFKGIR
ncbi:MAG TPA: hypothetical protein VG274_08500 [Rhizomicrobium sp.]|nr:hypothetical protein [Rhizomicrobium sp.]